jgi:hypothetical protein
MSDAYSECRSVLPKEEGGVCRIRDVGVIGGLTEKSICNVGAQHCVFVPRSRMRSEYGLDGVRYQLREKRN